MRCTKQYKRTPRTLFRDGDLFSQYVIGYHYGKLPHEMRRLSYSDRMHLVEFHKVYWFDAEKADVRFQKLCQTIAYFGFGMADKTKEKIGSLFGFDWLKWVEDGKKRKEKIKAGKTRPEGISVETYARQRKYAEDGWFEFPGKE